MHSKKQVQKNTQYEQDKRSSAVQSGLYFLINDYLAKDLYDYSSLHGYLQSLNINIKHSKTYGDKRFAFYLSLNNTDKLATLFNEKTKAHFSIDRDYIEFERAQNKMRMHYCHFTQEYANANKVVRLYFDSLGEFIEGTISDLNPRDSNKKRLEDQEIALIKENLAYASDILCDLILFKNDIAEYYVKLTIEKSRKLKEVALKNDMQNTNGEYLEYAKFREKAKKYPDTNFILTEINLNDLLACASEKLSEEEEEAPSVREKSIEQNVKNDINVKLENIQTQIDRLTSPKNVKFDWVLELLDVKEKLLDLLSYKNTLNKQTKRIARMADKIDEVITKRIQEKITVDNLNVEFLQANFVYIENFLSCDFYFDLISTFTTQTNPSKIDKMYHVCEFLFKNSFAYRKAIAMLEGIIGNETPKAAQLFMSCTENNNFCAFEMLLEQGVSLDLLLNNEAVTACEKGSKISLFNFILNYMALEIKINEAKLSLDHPLAEGESIDDVRIKLSKCSLSARSFVEIMLKPEYAKGMNTDVITCSSTNTRKEFLQMRLYAQKIVFDQKRKIMVVNDGTNDSTYMSSLSICTLFQTPADIFNLLLKSTKPNDVSLKTLALCYGYHLNMFGWTLIPIDQETDEVLFKISIDPNSEFLVDDQPANIVLENEQLLIALIAEKITLHTYKEIRDLAYKLSIDDKMLLAVQCGTRGAKLAALTLLLIANINGKHNKNNLRGCCSGILQLLFALNQNVLANHFISYLKRLNEKDIIEGIQTEIRRIRFVPQPVGDKKSLLWKYDAGNVTSKANPEVQTNSNSVSSYTPKNKIAQ